MGAPPAETGEEAERLLRGRSARAPDLVRTARSVLQALLPRASASHAVALSW